MRKLTITKWNLILLIGLVISGCSAQESETEIVNEVEEISTVVDSTDAIRDFMNAHPIPAKSQSLGTPGNGSLKNGALVPFEGKNYKYFSEQSYLMGRGFLNLEIREVLLNALNDLETTCPDRMFYIMETSLEDGGKMEPHRTHRNGTSIDFMVPKIKDGKPNYRLDTTGITHYTLSFNDDGTLFTDTSIVIDFQTLGEVILAMEESARNEGWKISKVIFKKELKDELYATEAGKTIKSKGIYITKNLSHIINVLHDDHIHVDFVKAN